MPPIVESRDLEFHRAENVIFNGLSFIVKSGEMVALLGANGVGKTTLLNLIAGLLHPTAGQLSVNGQDLAVWKRRDLSRFVALVPQHLDLPFSFRVEEIVAQGRVPYLGRLGSLSAHDHDVVERAMESVDVVKLRQRVYSELSGGERQRVKIAIGLAQEPKLILLDEPTQHLDIGRQIEAVALLRRLNQSGITIMAAVHDLNLARESFSHTILLTGEKCVAGATAEVMRPELLEKAYSVEASALSAYCEAQVESLNSISPQRDCRNTPLPLRSKRRKLLPRIR